MVPDANELAITDDSNIVGDTFIFEPSGDETRLGWLYIVAETKPMDGLGKDIVNTVVQALQKEYYRDPKRSLLNSFESALHQANIVLHDLAEQEIRDWMIYFNVAACVITPPYKSKKDPNQQPRSTLHVSTAGDAIVLISRKQRISNISSNLSGSPITDPLRTFSSVASGTIFERDLIFIGTSCFDQVFNQQDLVHFVADQSAETIAIHLSQLHEDKRNAAPLAAIVIAMISNDQINSLSTNSKRKMAVNREPIPVSTKLKPRKPLKIYSSTTKRIFLLLGRLLAHFWSKCKQVVWPYLKKSSRHGGKALMSASISAGHKIKEITTNKKGGKSPFRQNNPINKGLQESMSPKTTAQNLKRISNQLLRSATSYFKNMPRSSKIFATLAIIMAVLLGVSIVFLQKKRAADSKIQQTSEILHEAGTKKDAAETALIYDNREQARALLEDAERLVEEVAQSGLYQEQANELSSNITSVQDRLNKVMRVSTDTKETVGDFAQVIPETKPTQLFHLNQALYSFDPKSNIIVRMDKNGKAEKVTTATQGVGFFTNGSTHEADKSIILITEDPGIAIFDAKTEIVQKQEIQFPSDQSQIASIATYGSRVYILDKTANNIYGYGKTLRGYSGGTPWITDKDLNKQNITNIGVDGYIYTLHKDGSINKLLKGEIVDFNLEPTEPSISSQASLLVNEEIKHLYVFDPPNHRVIIFDTLGNLTRQIFLGKNSNTQDITVDTNETTLYLLQGTKVSSIPLEQ